MTFGRPKPWKRQPDLVPKRLGASAVDKGPVRSSDWLARIRGLPCLCCPHGRQTSPTRAHHTRGLFPRTIGRRISDLLCLPLCDGCHTDGPDALHRSGNELAWWRRRGVEPYGAILSCLAGCRDLSKEEAVAMIKMWRERSAA